MDIGYHVSHEQFTPAELLTLVVLAEKSGFDFASCSDHFHPWTSNQGQSGFAWAWLGAAMSKTSFDFSVVNCPSYRYHPAIIAQAAATLDVMFPNRFSLCVGSGEALNESITGQQWPSKTERNLRLQESVAVIRQLWQGKTVTHHGRIKVEDATLYTRPISNIPIIGAALTPQTAAFLAPWADELITISQPVAKLKEVLEAWHGNGGSEKPVCLKVQLSYDEEEDMALQGALEQWGSNVMGSAIASELKTPEQFEQVGTLVTAEQMYKFVNISSKIEQHVKWIREYKSLGFNKILLHNVNRNQELFIQTFGKEVLSQIKSNC